MNIGLFTVVCGSCSQATQAAAQFHATEAEGTAVSAMAHSEGEISTLPLTDLVYCRTVSNIFDSPLHVLKLSDTNY